MLLRTSNSRRCWKSTSTATSYSTTDRHESDRACVDARLTNRGVVRGVVAKDELPTRIVGACPTAFVCNTHDADKPGEHSIVIYIAGDRGEYFDSYGLPPLHTTFRKFLNDCCMEGAYNDKTLQKSSF